MQCVGSTELVDAQQPFGAGPYFLCGLNLVPSLPKLIEPRQRVEVVLRSYVPYAFQSIERTDDLDRRSPPNDCLSVYASGLSRQSRLRLKATKGNEATRIPKRGEWKGRLGWASALSLHLDLVLTLVVDSRVECEAPEAPRMNRRSVPCPTAAFPALPE